MQPRAPADVLRTWTLARTRPAFGCGAREGELRSGKYVAMLRGEAL